MMKKNQHKSLSRGISQDMSSEAILRRLEIVSELYETAKLFKKSRRLGKVENLKDRSIEKK